MIRNAFFAALAAGLLAAGPAWACPGHAADTGPGELSARPLGDGTAIGHSDVLEGQVAALDRESGRLILDTDFGLLHLLAEPAELEGIQEGDVIQVALVEDTL